MYKYTITENKKTEDGLTLSFSFKLNGEETSRTFFFTNEQVAQASVVEGKKKVKKKIVIVKRKLSENKVVDRLVSSCLENLKADL